MAPASNTVAGGTVLKFLLLPALMFAHAHAQTPYTYIVRGFCTYTVHMGTDYYGNDRYAYDGGVDDCQSSCDEDALCAGFVFSGDDNVCFIKSTMTTSSSKARTISYVKAAGSIGCSDHGYSVEYGQNYPFNDIVDDNYFRSISAPKCPDNDAGYLVSVDACLAGCDHNGPYCVGVVYNPYDQCCYLKSALTNKTPDFSAIMYKKPA